MSFFFSFSGKFHLLATLTTIIKVPSTEGVSSALLHSFGNFTAVLRLVFEEFFVWVGNFIIEEIEMMIIKYVCKDLEVITMYYELSNFKECKYILYSIIQCFMFVI